jgi:hypothetical protein
MVHMYERRDDVDVIVREVPDQFELEVRIDLLPVHFERFSKILGDEVAEYEASSKFQEVIEELGWQ